MKSYDLEPKYSSNEISGKCLKCLAEQEINSCLMQLMREDGINPEVHHKYQALVDFLQSPESEKLRIESERHLAEGKQVSVKITVSKGQPKYKLIVK
jgi:DNA-binding FadR family transcriptional regulator